MLTVGIHENVRLGENTEINENGSLVIELVQGSGLDAFESLMDDNAAIDETAKLFVNDFRYKMNKYGTEEIKSAGDLAKEVKKFSNFLKEFLTLYLTEDKVKETFSTAAVFADLGIAKEDFETEIRKESTMKKIYDGLVKAFVETCKINELFASDKLFRIKLVRQSADKHFPTFTAYTWKPWIESMKISKADSQVAFTPEEIEKGKNLSTPSASDNTSNEEASTAEELLNPTENAASDIFPDNLDTIN